MHKLSLLAAFTMFLLTLLRWTEVDGMERLANLFNLNKKNNSKNYSKLNSSSTNLLSQSSLSEASSSASLPFNPLQLSSSATKSSAQFMPSPQQSTLLSSAPKPSLSSFSSLFKLKPFSSFFPTYQTGQSTSYQIISNTLNEALANEEGILFALTEECNKIRDKKKCKKASFTYFQQPFTCEWAEKQINVVTGEIGWCTNSKASRAFFRE